VRAGDVEDEETPNMIDHACLGGRGGGGEAGGGEVGRADGDADNVRGVRGMQAAREPALERGLALLQLGGPRSRLLQLGGADLWPARRWCCYAPYALRAGTTPSAPQRARRAAGRAGVARAEAAADARKAVENAIERAAEKATEKAAEDS
jgi:hypothetical protein